MYANDFPAGWYGPGWDDLYHYHASGLSLCGLTRSGDRFEEELTGDLPELCERCLAIGREIAGEFMGG